MKVYIQPCGTASVLFEIFDALGQPVFCVTTGTATRGMRMLDTQGICRLKIGRARVFNAVIYGIRAGKRDFINVLQTMDASGPTYVIHGQPWVLRGDFLMHHFELLDQNGKLLMTHRSSWQKGQKYFVAELYEDEDIRYLGIAIALDCTLSNSQKQAIADSGM